MPFANPNFAIANFVVETCVFFFYFNTFPMCVPHRKQIGSHDRNEFSQVSLFQV